MGVELWCGEELIAANLGYALGDIHGGLTKFYLRSHSGAGMMLTSALAAWLEFQGFRLYATGQDSEYKRTGVLSESYVIGTALWLEKVHAARLMASPPSLVADSLPILLLDLLKGRGEMRELGP